MITTKEEEGKEETPELPPSMLFTQYLSTNLKYCFRFPHPMSIVGCSHG